MNTCPCSRPTQVVLCGRCADLLVGTLRDLADGWSVQDHRPAPPGLLEALDDHLTLRTRLADTGGTPIGRGGHVWKLPYAGNASTLIDRVRGTITRHTAAFYLANNHLHPQTTSLAAMCRWMAGHRALLASHADAAEMLADLTGIADRIRRTIDRRAEWAYIGECSEPTADGKCLQDIYAQPGVPVAQCGRCGHVHDVAERRAVLADALRHQLATLAELTRIVPYLTGVEINAHTLKTWLYRADVDRYPPREKDPKQATRYLISDAVSVVLDRTTRQAG